MHPSYARAACMIRRLKRHIRRMPGANSCAPCKKGAPCACRVLIYSELPVADSHGQSRPAAVSHAQWPPVADKPLESKKFNKLSLSSTNFH